MKHYPVENFYLYTSLHFPIVPNHKSIALFDNCLVYITSLVSNNYLGSNNCSVENNFHLLVNVLFTYDLLFRLMSVWNIIQFRMSIFYTSHHFLLCSSSKAVLCAIICLVYITSLVSNNYLGSNNCSVENNFHLLVNVLFASALLFRLLSVWNIIQFRMLSYTARHIPPCSDSEIPCFLR